MLILYTPIKAFTLGWKVIKHIKACNNMEQMFLKFLVIIGSVNEDCCVFSTIYLCCLQTKPLLPFTMANDHDYLISGPKCSEHRTGGNNYGSNKYYRLAAIISKTKNNVVKYKG